MKRQHPTRREAILNTPDSDPKDNERALYNNLIVNIRQKNPTMKTREVKQKARELAKSMTRGQRAQGREYMRDMEKLRDQDYAEAKPPEEK